MRGILVAEGHAADDAAILADALSRARIHGLRTNRDLLVNVLRHPAFLAGDTDTAFFCKSDDGEGVCRIVASGSTIFQGEALAGILIRF